MESNGELIGAETRGDGVRGTECLQNILTMKNVPKEIPYKDELIIDGETIIGWDTFREINDKLPEDKKYKHPRNLVSGSLQLLDSKEAASRNMRFVAWRVIKGFEHKTPSEDLFKAKDIGFEIIPILKSPRINQKEELVILLNQIRESADSHNIPYDGAVMAVDNYKIADSMGRTDKFFRHSMAYKYEDELFETILTDIEWNTSKTGLINPVAIFEPIDLNGAITTRAMIIALAVICMQPIKTEHKPPINEPYLILLDIDQTQRDWQNKKQLQDKLQQFLREVNPSQDWYVQYSSLNQQLNIVNKLHSDFSQDELLLLYKIVEAEVTGENKFESKVNVASTIFNRLDSELFPNSLEEILTTPAQFSSYFDGRYSRVEILNETIQACEYAYEFRNTDALFFDSCNGTSWAASSRQYLFTDNVNHNFYK